MYLGSDALALAPFTNLIAYLDEGDWVVLHRKGATFYDKSNNAQVERRAQRVAAGAFLVEKGNHRHFMIKEIYEQPEVVGHTLTQYLDMAAGTVNLPFGEADRLGHACRACRSRPAARPITPASIGKYWFEKLARLPVEIDVASEFRYREAPLPKDGLALFVSQSGETADTLACLRYAKQEAQSILSVVNVPTSTIARESDAVAPTHGRAGDRRRFDQGLHLSAHHARLPRARRRPRPRHALRRGRGALRPEPDRAARADGRRRWSSNRRSRSSRANSRRRATCSISAAGRAIPLALEGALKLKEISYIHAEGYPAGELKHGPIALIDEAMPVIVDRAP